MYRDMQMSNKKVQNVKIIKTHYTVLYMYANFQMRKYRILKNEEHAKIRDVKISEIKIYIQRAQSDH